MTENIYGDVLFVINFSMDFLSLYITSRIMKTRPKAWRMMVSASAGGVYGVAALFFPFGEPLLSLCGVLCAVLMCLITFGGGLKKILISSAVFYGAGMLLGGVMTLIYSKIGRYTGYISIGGSISTVFGELPLWLFAVLAVVSALITAALGRIFRRKSVQRSEVVTFSVCGARHSVECLVDSGNLLCEPISGVPVVFISEREAGFVPEKLLAAMRSGGECSDYDVMRRLRFAFATGVGGKRTVVCAVPDVCAVGDESCRALFAVDFGGGDYGGFGGLVPEILVT